MKTIFNVLSIATLAVSLNAQAQVKVSAANLAGVWRCTQPRTSIGALVKELLTTTELVRTSVVVGQNLRQTLFLKDASFVHRAKVESKNVDIALVESLESQAQFFSTRYYLMISAGEEGTFIVPVQDKGFEERSITFKQDTGKAKSDLTCTKNSPIFDQ